MPVIPAPSAFVESTEYVVQLETPQDSVDPEAGQKAIEGDGENRAESSQTLRKAA